MGGALAARLPSAEAYAAHVAVEHAWLPKLAPRLPWSIPEVVGRGRPTAEYPHPWSLCRWIQGDTAIPTDPDILCDLARDLATFLNALQAIDTTGAPPPGDMNFHRGGDLAVYDAETRQSARSLDGTIDTDSVLRTWDSARETRWERPPVWIHGDIAPGNLLFTDGKLSAVIDFGQLAAGDPACDLAIAWTVFRGSSREIFRRSIDTDDNTWLRGRAWALWKVLITLDGEKDPASARSRETRRIIAETVA